MSAPPRCEICRREPAISFSWFADATRWYADRSGTWKFAGMCASTSENYWILTPQFLSGPARWRAHLAEKRWFNADDFEAMVARYEAAAGSLAPPRLRVAKARRGRDRMNLKARP